MTLPIFMINLERSVARREKAQGAFDAIGVPLRFHAAADGVQRDLTRSPRYDSAVRVERYGADLSSREIGCYLSHLELMERCLNDGVDRAVILEDDVAPAPGFAETVSQLAAAPEVFEMIRFYGVRKRASERVCALAPGVDLVWPTHGLCGSQGYYLTAAAMRKILAGGGKIILPYDMMLDRYWRTGLTIFATSPFVITEEAQASDIGQRQDLWADGSHQWLHARLKLGKLAERVSRTTANADRRSHLTAWRREGEAAFSAVAHA
jgi:glycosyl transferase, family 25